MSFEAWRNSECPDCNAPIVRGQLIEGTRKRGVYRHVICEPIPCAEYQAGQADYNQYKTDLLFGEEYAGAQEYARYLKFGE